MKPFYHTEIFLQTKLSSGDYRGGVLDKAKGPRSLSHDDTEDIRRDTNQVQQLVESL